MGLGDLADARTIRRGQDYADRGLVVGLADDGDRITALVRGTEDYRVELVAAKRSWFCTCPVGVTGAFCKHCVAVAIHAAGGSGGPGTEPVELDTFDVRSGDDLTVLADEVVRVFTPRRRFYDYDQANAYADATEATTVRLEEWSRRAPSAELLTIVQDAIDRAVRTILRSDDSSGGQGMQIGRLLDAHRNAARHASLDRKAATALVRWLYRVMFAGPQDFLTVDIDQYADAVGPAGIDLSRRLLDRADDSHAWALRHARGRLAVLGRDPEQIRAHFGGDRSRAFLVDELARALEEAGHADLAFAHAREGLAADPRSPYAGPLVERLVADAQRRGAVDEAARLRPTTSTTARRRPPTPRSSGWPPSREAGRPSASERTRCWQRPIRRAGCRRCCARATPPRRGERRRRCRSASASSCGGGCSARGCGSIRRRRCRTTAVSSSIA